MFTGIVQSQVNVLSAINEKQQLKLILKVPKELTEQLLIGASIAINGVCLTVVEFAEYDQQHNYVVFDVIDETLRVTNLAKISQGDFVNYERSLKVGDEMGGHLVSGHVHFVAKVTEIMSADLSENQNCAITFACPENWMKYIQPKGFITVNGCSLTVGEVTINSFTVHLIPETLSRTNLGKLGVNNLINIEIDQQTMTIINTIERLQLLKN